MTKLFVIAAELFLFLCALPVAAMFILIWGVKGTRPWFETRNGAYNP